MTDLVWKTFQDWKRSGMVVMKGQKGKYKNGKWVFSQEQVTKIETPSEWYERQYKEEGQILIRSYERQALFDQMTMKKEATK